VKVSLDGTDSMSFEGYPAWSANLIFFKRLSCFVLWTFRPSGILSGFYCLHPNHVDSTSQKSSAPTPFTFRSFQVPLPMLEATLRILLDDEAQSSPRFRSSHLSNVLLPAQPSRSPLPVFSSASGNF
jgi:hypothetical protein